MTTTYHYDDKINAKIKKPGMVRSQLPLWLRRIRLSHVMDNPMECTDCGCKLSPEAIEAGRDVCFDCYCYLQDKNQDEEL